MPGKAYANCKPKNERPKGDFYSTPKSLVWVAEDIIKTEFSFKNIILDPCCGKKAITVPLVSMGYKVHNNDLFERENVYHNVDYLNDRWFEKQIITNPPFSLWDEFVMKAKTHCKKFMLIGRLNYLGCSGRSISDENCKNCPYSNQYGYCGKYNKPVSKISDSQCENDEILRDFKNSFIYKNLKGVYPFNRYVDYQTPYRTDGLFHVGAMATAWFLWDMEFKGDAIIKQLDVQKYATLGGYKEND